VDILPAVVVGELYLFLDIRKVLVDWVVEEVEGRPAQLMELQEPRTVGVEGEEVVIQEMELAAPVVPVSSSSATLQHKYSKTTIRWLFVRSIIHKQDF
jgi:hypothetical protein